MVDASIRNICMVSVYDPE